MRLPRVRFTVRQMMVAVAVVALAMGGFVGVRAVWQYVVSLDRVLYHSGMEATHRWLGLDQIGDDLEGMAHEPGLTEEGRHMRELRRIVALWHRQKEYHAAMAQIPTRRQLPLAARRTRSTGATMNSFGRNG